MVIGEINGGEVWKIGSRGNKRRSIEGNDGRESSRSAGNYGK